MKTIIITVLAVFSATLWADTLVHSFQSPAFIPGSGYSNHVLTIEQLEANRRKAIADADKAARDQAARDAKNTNLAKFLVNVESRIYAQLSKQLADAMFSDGANSGAMDFQGTNINWVKTGTDVTLTIREATGGVTTVTVPIGSFAF
ncbi:Type VIII secretion system, CsgF [uncultured Caudovirales phage]|uniref:Type VIII secretion system, CsgF n=1 Tax=uncultured Caudovirales phage TaxID=2100421 RepID=A0A6J5LZL7_9CAUD|nr:Type VIII secretion system, CsgF [uncultured Caudovirales phage]